MWNLSKEDWQQLLLYCFFCSKGSLWSGHLNETDFALMVFALKRFHWSPNFKTRSCEVKSEHRNSTKKLSYEESLNKTCLTFFLYNQILIWQENIAGFPRTVHCYWKHRIKYVLKKLTLRNPPRIDIKQISKFFGNFHTKSAYLINLSKLGLTIYIKVCQL